MTRPPIAPLFVPGDRPQFFAKAAASEADAVIVDLEDAVDPARKDEARRNLVAHRLQGKPVFVRISGASSEHFSADLAVLREASVHGVILAKAEAASEVAAAAAATSCPAIIPLVETVAGLSRIDAILRAPKVLCAAFGSLDYALDLGCDPLWEPLLHARSTLVFTSRAAGVSAPIDGVTPTLDDPALLEADAERARAFGFGGKLTVHPKQAGPVLAAFRPSAAEIDWANKVLAAAIDGGSLKVDGKMVDKPVIEKARRIASAAGAPQ